MAFEANVTIPRAFALWAPKVGYVTNAIGISKRRASDLLSDRKANGEAFEGERVVPVRVRVRVPDSNDKDVTGYLL